jgi:hypothetical protein
MKRIPAGLVVCASVLGKGVGLRSEVEVELIRKCRSGDARFFEPLVRAYEGPGLRVATGMLGDVDDARDALQEAFVKVFRNLSKDWSSAPRTPSWAPSGPVSVPRRRRSFGGGWRGWGRTTGRSWC